MASLSIRSFVVSECFCWYVLFFIVLILAVGLNVPTTYTMYSTYTFDNFRWYFYVYNETDLHLNLSDNWS